MARCLFFWGRHGLVLNKWTDQKKLERFYSFSPVPNMSHFLYRGLKIWPHEKPVKSFSLCYQRASSTLILSAMKASVLFLDVSELLNMESLNTFTSRYGLSLPGKWTLGSVGVVSVLISPSCFFSQTVVRLPELGSLWVFLPLQYNSVTIHHMFFFVEDCL